MEWEYETRVVSVGAGPGLKEMLNQLGAEGWELVAWPLTTEEPKLQAFIFKRAKQSAPSPESPASFEEPQYPHGYRQITLEE